MTRTRNILLALIIVMAAASTLYAGKKDKHDRNDAPRPKNAKVQKAPAGKPAPRAMKETPRREAREAPRAARAHKSIARRPEKNRHVEKRVIVKQPAAKRPPRQTKVKVVHVKQPQPQPRKVVKVVHVYPDDFCCNPTDREVFYITILNRTNRTLELELDGSHEGDDDIGKLYPGEGMEYPMVVKTKKLPETFELEAGPYEVEFTLTHRSPRELVLVITPGGIYAE
ncbi:MAG: hypothetical protein JXA11_00175 [Phycisphaerae bacterium]|nr:hypothetical protein [Phycisphaerae bacterium]